MPPATEAEAKCGYGSESAGIDMMAMDAHSQGSLVSGWQARSLVVLLACALRSDGHQSRYTATSPCCMYVCGGGREEVEEVEEEG